MRDIDTQTPAPARKKKKRAWIAISFLVGCIAGVGLTFSPLSMEGLGHEAGKYGSFTEMMLHEGWLALVVDSLLLGLMFVGLVWIYRAVSRKMRS